MKKKGGKNRKQPSANRTRNGEYKIKKKKTKEK